MTKGELNKQQLCKDLETVYSLQPDRWGHYKFYAGNKNLYRIKMQKRSVRFEKKVGEQWCRLSTTSSGKVHYAHFAAWLCGCRPA